MLRLLAGFEEPTAGYIRIFGHPPQNISREGKLGFMFQRPTLYPWLTVEENVALPLRILARYVPASVLQHLSLVGLDNFRYSSPDELSGGMQQRVALARALVTQPRLLLLDEPFGALDEVTRLRLNLDVSQILVETDATTILVTHSITEALLLADRIAVLNPSGRALRLIVSNPFPSPRRGTILASPGFHSLANMLRGLLE